MINRISFGRRLRSLRKDRNLTQEKLAEMIDAESAETISRYETGKNFPYPDKLEKLVKALNITYDELLDIQSAIKKSQSKLKDNIIFEISNGMTERDLKIIYAQIKAYKDNKR